MSNPEKRKGKYVRNVRKKHMSLPVVVLLDILLVGVIMVIFASFHHVIPAMQNGQFDPIEWVGDLLGKETEPPVTEAPETIPPTDAVPETAAPVPMETQPVETGAPETEPEVTEPTVDNRTQWQIKFADKFTDEVVVTDHSYTSPEVSITIDTVTVGEGNSQIVYHVADVYVASLENFYTYTANNEMIYFGTQDVEEMIADSNAILAISGDFLTYQKSGFMMRNGEIYVESSNGGNICALFEDGTMETYLARTYQIDELKEKGVVQVWSFGPPLLNEDGTACTTFKTSSTVLQRNPRSAIGYYEPGHYCFVVVDGRQKGYSAGMTLDELAQVFEELGCTRAYNLDGGGSAVMLFNGEAYSRQSNGGRDLGDILVISESGYAMSGGEGTE